MNTQKEEEQLKHEALKRKLDFISEQVKQMDIMTEKSFPSLLSIRPIKNNDESNLTDDLNIPITVLKPPPNQAGDYTDTLEQWGDLPEVLPLPDAARYFGHKCKQNPSAILKILSDAVLSQTIIFWGLRASGEWEQGLFRVYFPASAKPKLKIGATKTEIKIFTEKYGRLHVEAMGVKPGDVLAMLESRGRKVPDELKHLSQTPKPPPNDDVATSETKQAKPNNSKHWHDKAREIADDIDRRDESQGGQDSLIGIADRVAKKFREMSIQGSHGPLTGSTIKRDALQGGKWVRPRDKKLAEETGGTGETKKPI
jgi:hypothetical protein